MGSMLQFILFLRHCLQFYPNLLVTTSPSRTPVERGYPPDHVHLSPIAREGETLIRDRVELILMMVAPISACLSCHISRLSTTTRGPCTCWICSRTRASSGCALHDAAFCLPVFIFFTITPPSFSHCCLPRHLLFLVSLKSNCLSRSWSWEGNRRR